jgi:5-(aminomethyl)-3-furanmethanol phosphate kinase
MTLVVKLGGSLAKARTLANWLEVLSRHGSGRTVVVPGGGVFADAVRAAQASYRFSDLAAHRMALLAMEQYALLLADLAPDFRLCDTEAGIRAALASGRVALWQPCPMVDAAPEVTASWDVTSDSLAAWLARKLDARRLLLIKSTAVAPPHDAHRLAALAIVDPAFPAYAAGAKFGLRCFGPGEEECLAAELRSEVVLS